jgi:TPR repeat protein
MRKLKAMRNFPTLLRFSAFALGVFLGQNAAADPQTRYEYLRKQALRDPASVNFNELIDSYFLDPIAQKRTEAIRSVSDALAPADFQKYCSSNREKTYRNAETHVLYVSALWVAFRCAQVSKDTAEEKQFFALLEGVTTAVMKRSAGRDHFHAIRIFSILEVQIYFLLLGEDYHGAVTYPIGGQGLQNRIVASGFDGTHFHNWYFDLGDYASRQHFGINVFPDTKRRERQYESTRMLADAGDQSAIIGQASERFFASGNLQASLQKLELTKSAENSSIPLAYFEICAMAGADLECRKKVLAPLLAWAEENNADAFSLLAVAHELGIGVAADQKASRLLLSKAMRLNPDPFVLTDYAILLQNVARSKGVVLHGDSDPLKYWTQAARLGDGAAITQLLARQKEEKEPTIPLAELGRLADASRYPPAQYLRSLQLRKAGKSEAARSLLEKAAAAQSTDAMFDLARLLDSTGIDADRAKAHSLYRQAGELGHQGAIVNYVRGQLNKVNSDAEELMLRGWLLPLLQSADTDRRVAAATLLRDRLGEANLPWLDNPIEKAAAKAKLDSYLNPQPSKSAEPAQEKMIDMNFLAQKKLSDLWGAETLNANDKLIQTSAFYRLIRQFGSSNFEGIATNILSANRGNFAAKKFVEELRLGQLESAQWLLRGEQIWRVMRRHAHPILTSMTNDQADETDGRVAIALESADGLLATELAAEAAAKNDMAQSAFWYKLSADHGYAPAIMQESLRMLKRSGADASALQQLRRAASSGYNPARTELATFLCGWSAASLEQVKEGLMTARAERVSVPSQQTLRLVANCENRLRKFAR